MNYTPSCRSRCRQDRRKTNRRGSRDTASGLKRLHYRSNKSIATLIGGDTTRDETTTTSVLTLLCFGPDLSSLSVQIRTLIWFSSDKMPLTMALIHVNVCAHQFPTLTLIRAHTCTHGHTRDLLFLGVLLRASVSSREKYCCFSRFPLFYRHAKSV